MKKKQILVCGTGFGKIYLKAIAESKEYELMGIKSIFYDLEKRHLIKKENDGIE